MSFLVHRRQYLAQRRRCETGGMIGKRIRDDQFAVVNDGAASIHNIRHVTFPFVFVRWEQRFAETADHFARIVTIQKKSADAAFAQGPNAMAENQPTRLGLDGDPQFPICTNSQGKVGFSSSVRSCQKWMSSENMR
jgi:hypothetical protein